MQSRKSEGEISFCVVERAACYKFRSSMKKPRDPEYTEVWQEEAHVCVRVLLSV